MMRIMQLISRTEIELRMMMKMMRKKIQEVDQPDKIERRACTKRTFNWINQLKIWKRSFILIWIKNNNLALYMELNFSILEKRSKILMLTLIKPLTLEIVKTKALLMAFSNNNNKAQLNMEWPSIKNQVFLQRIIMEEYTKIKYSKWRDKTHALIE